MPGKQLALRPNHQVPVAISDAKLRRHATRIHALMNAVGKNTIELGFELAEAKEYFESLPIATRGGWIWAKWLAAEFGIGSDWVRRLIRAAKASTDKKNAKVKAAYVLAMLTGVSSSPAVAEIRERVARGESMSHHKARAISRRHTRKGREELPSPKEANRIAARSGCIVIASDGRMYTGSTEEEENAIAEQRAIIYSTRRAIDVLAGMQKSPEEFLQYASDHQLWTADEEHVLAEALKWLTNLFRIWPEHRARFSHGG